MIAKGYKLPHEFPHESFIQEVLVDFFESEGYSIIEEKPIDIKCSNADKNETWIIEVKGKTSQIGLDFKTCLGQIVMRMNNPDYIYAIAMPDIEQYHKQVNKVSSKIAAKINLNWIFVSDKGTIEIIRNCD